MGAVNAVDHSLKYKEDMSAHEVTRAMWAHQIMKYSDLSAYCKNDGWVISNHQLGARS